MTQVFLQEEENSNASFLLLCPGRRIVIIWSFSGGKIDCFKLDPEIQKSFLWTLLIRKIWSEESDFKWLKSESSEMSGQHSPQLYGQWRFWTLDIIFCELWKLSCTSWLIFNLFHACWWDFCCIRQGSIPSMVILKNREQRDSRLKLVFNENLNIHERIVCKKGRLPRA